MTAIRLVRHTEVARIWRGRCYGITDVGLSRQGAAALGPLSAELAAGRPAWVVHSGLSRTVRLARLVAMRADCPLIEEEGWRERDFGAWEGHSWAAIYRASGDAMDGMIDAPDTFRPGGGETTTEMAERVLQAWQRLPPGAGVVVTHGGPIAGLLGRKGALPVREWVRLIRRAGACIEVRRSTEPNS